MPCPFFEPQRVAPDPLHPAARLPLIEEYEGLCHARGGEVHACREIRFRYCNQGYSEGACENFSSADAPACARFSVLRRSETVLEILSIEERNYAPLRWQPVSYSIVSDCLDVEMDACQAAQVLAFCRSYLRRFPA